MLCLILKQYLKLQVCICVYGRERISTYVYPYQLAFSEATLPLTEHATWHAYGWQKPLLDGTNHTEYEQWCAISPSHTLSMYCKELITMMVAPTCMQPVLQNFSLSAPRAKHAFFKTYHFNHTPDETLLKCAVVRAPFCVLAWCVRFWLYALSSAHLQHM